VKREINLESLPMSSK